MNKTKKITWPLTIRLIHWSIAVIVILNMFILEDGDPPHRYLGYAAVVIVAVRFFYGFLGKGHVLFSQFPMGFLNLKTFLKTHFTNHPTDYEGHNPLASIVYFLIWFAIIALGITGWMLGLDAFWGDENLQNIHKYISNFLGALTVIHFLGIIFDSIIHKRKTWMGMIK